MFHPYFTKSSPVGCIVGCFWMMLGALCILCFYIHSKAEHANPPRPDIAAQSFWFGVELAVLLAVTLVPMIWFAIRAEQDR